MRFRVVVLAVSLAVSAAACSGSPKAVAKSPSPVRSATPASPSPAALRVGGATPPAVRLFAGTQSVTGSAIKYCLRGDCVERKSQAIKITTSDDSTVAFAVARIPERATVKVQGESGPAVVLAPASFMALPGKLVAGVHRMTLTMFWQDAEGVWTFEVRAT